MEGIPWGRAGGDGAQGVSMGQTGPFCRGQAANGAFQAGEFCDGTGFPRKSSLAAAWRHVGEAHPEAAEGPREIVAATQEGVRRLRSETEAAGTREENILGDIKEGGSAGLVDLAGRRVGKVHPGVIPKGLSWGSGSPRRNSLR